MTAVVPIQAACRQAVRNTRIANEPKTNAAFLLLHELARLGIPFLVFDWKKNYRDLLGRRAFGDLAVYTVGRDDAPFFFNPLIPPRGVAPREWIKKLIQIM